MATITSAGAVAATPTELLNKEIAIATTLSPGLTANLPGSLVEDMASTAAGALVIQDQAFVDLVNSISPYAANSVMLYQLGAVYGVQQGVGSNTSVYVTFTGTAGFVIPIGFTVSDGNYQYTVQDGGIIGSSGSSSALYCLATTSGTWAVPSGTVTQIITSVPSGYTLTCSNLTDGTPGATSQSLQAYQAQVIQAGLATCQGTPKFTKTLLQNVSGVQARLVSITNPSTGAWKIICGGGDPYQVGDAIYRAIPDISMLVGSSTTARNITVTINDYPDTYSVIFVNPPVQTVAVTVTWNTISTNLVSPASISQLSAQPIADYINSIVVGQPINTFDIQDIFAKAVATVLPVNQISKIDISVSINGTVVPPVTGTFLVYGDSESYFSTSVPNITITQG